MKGPVFHRFLLADEINRTSPKTQSALLEVMEEHQVTIDGTSYPLPEPFLVVATQNPVEQEGTYKLPEAQTDRFMMKLTIGYPTIDEEVTILERHHQNQRLTALENVQPVITKEELVALREKLGEVFVDEALLRYIASIVMQTRQSRSVFLGASPRASVAMLQASKAYALLQGRDFLTPDDVKQVVPAVLQHRLVLTAEAEMEGFTPQKVARRLLDKVEVPK
jgi:MoxR-like ATPase